MWQTKLALPVFTFVFFVHQKDVALFFSAVPVFLANWELVLKLSWIFLCVPYGSLLLLLLYAKGGKCMSYG